jgi:hypothetical protein
MFICFRFPGRYEFGSLPGIKRVRELANRLQLNRGRTDRSVGDGFLGRSNEDGQRHLKVKDRCPVTQEIDRKMMYLSLGVMTETVLNGIKLDGFAAVFQQFS